MCVVMRKLRKQVRKMGQLQTGDIIYVEEPQITDVTYTWSTNTLVNDSSYDRWYPSAGV